MSMCKHCSKGSQVPAKGPRSQPVSILAVEHDKCPTGRSEGPSSNKIVVLSSNISMTTIRSVRAEVKVEKKQIQVLGAKLAQAWEVRGFRVYKDQTGHPYCL